MLPNPSDPFPPVGDPPPAGHASRRGGRRAPFTPSPGMLLLRIAIFALGLVIGIVLLSRGDVVLGLLLVAFAGLRGAMFLSMQRRRAQWRAARPGRSRLP
jgi:hypothetical protein